MQKENAARVTEAVLPAWERFRNYKTTILILFDLV
jgi:hypothetical protein